MKTNQTYQILLMTFFGFFGSILIGFIFYNTSIFIFRRVSFQFVATGLFGALFFSLLEYKNLREQILGMIAILFIELTLIGKNLSVFIIIRDVFYLGAIFLSVKLYYEFIKRNSKIKYYLRSLALVLIYGFIDTLFLIIVYIINTESGLPPFGFIYFTARNAILIGLGIGLGLDFYIQNEKRLFGLLKIKTT